MKVLYDHQIFEHQRIGGVSRYFSEIIRHLPSDIEADVSVEYSFNEYLKNLDTPFVWKDQLITYNHFLPQVNFRGKKRLFAYLANMFPDRYPDLYKINQQQTIKKLKSKDFDIFHPTFFDDYYLDHIGNKPYVLTVHDMIIEMYPEFINSPEFIKRKKKLVDNATHIIAVSENTKKDIINVFGTSADKISITYHGASLQENSDKPLNLPKHYLLYVGDRRMGYKNFLFFVAAVQPILHQRKELHIVCTGDKFSSEELHYFNSLGIASQMKIIFVDDKEMYGLYASAQLFIYPSYYEGFGIPILEAFQAKCPVVLANSSCFPEVAGEAGLFFDTKSHQDLRHAVISILDNKTLRNEMIDKGSKRLEQFSWEKSALQTAQIYKKILARNE
ncbi:MAG: hypothetical protein RL662_786 [Bacteroidota bacterium]|jgi:glycosyltransferase involved in cell wall biosynthesis